MSALGTRLSAGIALVGVLILLSSLPAGNLFARLLITVLTMAVIAVLALAVQAYLQERKPTEVAAEPAVPLIAPQSPTAPAVPAIIPAPTRSRTPTFELTQAPSAAVVPRFGKGSRAQQRSWRLPVQPSPVQGIVADQAEIGVLTVRAASVVGPGHRCEEPGVVRQDAYRLGRDVTGDHLVVAVADGLSNSPRSDLGAAVAVSSVVSAITKRLRIGLVPSQLSAPDLFDEVAERIRAEAGARGIADRDVCTVLITAILPVCVPEGESRTGWVGWLGDASMWHLSDDRWRMMAGNRKQDEGGIASNALAAVLPNDPQTARGRPLPLTCGDVLTLVTDGVGDGLVGLPPLNRFLAKEWARPPSIADFINHVGYDAEQFTDDRSAVTVWVGNAVPSPRSRRPR